jgi:hypothetical protein
MGSGFSNPLVGGGGSLVYPSIHSPGFSLSPFNGWSIDKNGNAYFASITADGTITAGTFAGTNYEINSDGAFWYNGTPALGNLTTSVTNNAGTDQYGNTYLEGVTNYQESGGVWYAVQLQNGDLSFLAAATAGGTYAATFSSTSSLGPSTAINAALTLTPRSFQISAPGSALTDVIASLGLKSAASGAGSAIATIDAYLQSVDSGGDGNTYPAGELVVWTTGPTDINSTSPVTILSANVAERTYLIQGSYVYTIGSTPTAVKQGFSGPGTTAPTDISFDWKLDLGTGTTTAGTNNITSLSLVTTASQTANDTYITHFDGIITFTGAGTFEVIGEENAAGDTWTVLAGAYVRLKPLGPVS